MEESVEPISLVDYSKAFHDVDRYMDIWDWLVYNGNGYGYGEGNGNGFGYGYGYGDGSGDGFGYGFGDGYDYFNAYNEEH